MSPGSSVRPRPATTSPPAGAVPAGSTAEIASPAKLTSNASAAPEDRSSRTSVMVVVFIVVLSDRPVPAVVVSASAPDVVGSSGYCSWTGSCR
ncbi:hypothetical protein [Saccharopolyspora sp. 6V]|uniref:hypothetical protein n=1 Tax=Saccharopolyspora sp. 6V TaxID=2877239 RepID=UPI001CD445B9|nr:hypothetical protein [Saccharopolyspora sp. 6V]MCA1192606.1 hypothetical protein [Saccharopolyspora sp. 6V]